MTLFEYGSGHSTLFWKERVASVVSVEHDESWFEEMAPQLGDTVDYRLIISSGDYTRSAASGEYDIVVIDGERRSDCVEPAIEALRPGGFIVFDNCDWFPDDAARLRGAGFIEVDFTGFGPINPYMSTTSLFLSPDFRPRPLDVMPQTGVAGIRQRLVHELGDELLHLGGSDEGPGSGN